MKQENLQYFGKRFIYDNVILYMLTRRLQHLSSPSVFSRNLCFSEYCFVDYCSHFSAFSYDDCIVFLPYSDYPLCYLQTFLTEIVKSKHRQMNIWVHTILYIWYCCILV